MALTRAAKQLGLPPCGGSGLKCASEAGHSAAQGLPPCGGSGLKWFVRRICGAAECLPPCGGSGLKFPVFPQLLTAWCLPPCGGSGLKCKSCYAKALRMGWSPSMRREWIEIFDAHSCRKKECRLPPCGGSGLKCRNEDGITGFFDVSLHAEGVD